MITIAQMADRLGEHICKQAGEDSELKKVCFGIEIILVMTIFFLTTIAAGWFFGLFKETVIILLSALLMKFIIGGSHLSGFFRCLIYSISLALGGAWLCKTHQIWLTIPTLLILLALDLFTLITGALSPSYRTLTSKQIIARKICACCLALILATIYLYYPNYLVAGALIGFSISIINISPIGADFVRWLDRITKQGGAVQ